MSDLNNCCEEQNVEVASREDSITNAIKALSEVSATILKEIDDLKRIHNVTEAKKHNLSYIEDHEEQEALEFVEKNLGFPRPRACGALMYVKTYVNEEDVTVAKDKAGNPILGHNGEPIKIAVPHSVSARDKFLSCTGLVVSQGPLSYKHEKYKESGPLCKVGDWIVFAGTDGAPVNFRGVPMRIIHCDGAMSVVEDPSWVTRV